MGLGFSGPVYSLHLFTVGARAGCVLDCLAEISSNVPGKANVRMAVHVNPVGLIGAFADVSVTRAMTTGASQVCRCRL